MSQPIAQLLASALLVASVHAGPAEGAGAIPGVAGPAPAADVASMTVDIWPEYDDPGVLVIYRGRLDAPEEVPTAFSLVIPAGARIHMVGGVAGDGRHIHSRYRTRARDDGLVEVAYTLEVPDFYMEFYYDPLGSGEKRSFAYPVTTTHPAGSVTVRVQRPRRAEDFSVMPSGADVVRDGNGFAYDVLRWEGLPARTTREVSVRYRKPDRQPSVQPSPPAEAGSEPGDPDLPGGLDLPLPGGLRLLGLLLIGTGGYMIYRGWRKEPPLPGSRAETRSGGDTPAGNPAAPPDTGQRYCTHCGGTVEPEDRYCTRCGGPTIRRASRPPAGGGG